MFCAAVLLLLSSVIFCQYKIIGLVPVRNEERLIVPCLKALSMYTDAIIVLDDASEDNTVSVIKSLQQECSIVEIITKNTWYRDEPGDRNRLLEAGRKHGGTHFIVIDADELFSANCLENDILRKTILSLQPGDFLEVSWINLWRSPWQYRFDDSVWSQQNVSIAFCDDRRCTYVPDNTMAGFIHTARIPTKMLNGKCVRLQQDKEAFFYLEECVKKLKEPILGGGYDRKNIVLQRFLYDYIERKGLTVRQAAACARKFFRNGWYHNRSYAHDMSIGLLHFQFANWDNLLAKQAWYRCLEKIRNPDVDSAKINKIYGQSKNENNIRLHKCPKEWFLGYQQFLDLDVYITNESWQKKQITKWFVEYGKDYFKELDIWDINWD